MHIDEVVILLHTIHFNITVWNKWNLKHVDG